MQDIPGKQQKEVQPAEDQEDAGTPEVDRAERCAACFQALHLNPEPHAEQAGEQGVGLVGNEQAQPEFDRAVERGVG
ncbi:MAG TPA: hypothetical protein DHU71_12005 [Erythrobacter sp.]|nr:hypothetical protein [Erythrobacter sp.]